MSRPLPIVVALIVLACSSRNNADFQNRVQSLNLKKGEVTLCGGEDRLGTVSFASGCSADAQADFNMATALLHSFEYPEAEKVFARVMEKDPTCLMAYWGAAMSLFHPLWEPPSPTDLEKGAKVIALGREVAKETGGDREREYLEAIATIYDDWQSQNHPTRLAKFEAAAQNIYEKHPDDAEAAIFYALALRAASDPADKTYVKQKKAGEILLALEKERPNHPGIVHYLIHIYDYPELAQQGLAAARSYAQVAAASAHAQHMPSHIFIRLGLWEEAIQSNQSSIASAQCYAKKEGIKGHWDEELHGMDYIMYSYLQRGDDKAAHAQLDSLANLGEVFPSNFKVAYSVAAMPARYVIERKDWKAATELKLPELNMDWEKFPWEKSNYSFARALGFAHTKQVKLANDELEQLKKSHALLQEKKDGYKSNLVSIQVKGAEAWIRLAEGKKTDAIKLMTEAADLEDKTEKHPVTPGEIVPARELLGDMYAELGQYDKALDAYKASLATHPNRFNGLTGAMIASKKTGSNKDASQYLSQLISIADPGSERVATIRSSNLVSSR